MSKSYQLIDDTPFDRQILYDFLNAYFDSPQVQKTKNDENSGTSVYMTRINSLLASPEQRFLVVITDADAHPVGTVIALSDLKWKSLQTRMLSQFDRTIHRHSYLPKNQKKYALRMKLLQRYPNRSEYEIENFPGECVVALMHSNPNQAFEFPDQVICSGSIELYRTVFMMK